IQDLIKAGALKKEGAKRLALGVAASSSDRLWLRVGEPSTSLVEVIDPNGDGKWGDRAIHRFRLPSPVPGQVEGPDSGRWSLPQLLAEPSLAGEDRSRSILVTASNALAFRVFRIADLNDDSDALDEGEVRLLFSGQLPSLSDGPDVPAIAAR